jgi:hypothetical protein
VLAEVLLLVFAVVPDAALSLLAVKVSTVVGLTSETSGSSSGTSGSPAGGSSSSVGTASSSVGSGSSVSVGRVVGSSSSGSSASSGVSVVLVVPNDPVLVWALTAPSATVVDVVVLVVLSESVVCGVVASTDVVSVVA